VGASVGDMVGWSVGDLVGWSVGSSVGDGVGEKVGVEDGDAVGEDVGSMVVVETSNASNPGTEPGVSVSTVATSSTAALALQVGDCTIPVSHGKTVGPPTQLVSTSHPAVDS
jgi:autotransporter translocation and assembly factor TamB